MQRASSISEQLNLFVVPIVKVEPEKTEVTDEELDRRFFEKVCLGKNKYVPGETELL